MRKINELPRQLKEDLEFNRKLVLEGLEKMQKDPSPLIPFLFSKIDQKRLPRAIGYAKIMIGTFEGFLDFVFLGFAEYPPNDDGWSPEIFVARLLGHIMEEHSEQLQVSVEELEQLFKEQYQ